MSTFLKQIAPLVALALAAAQAMAGLETPPGGIIYTPGDTPTTPQDNGSANEVADVPKANATNQVATTQTAQTSVTGSPAATAQTDTRQTGLPQQPSATPQPMTPQQAQQLITNIPQADGNAAGALGPNGGPIVPGATGIANPTQTRQTDRPAAPSLDGKSLVVVGMTGTAQKISSQTNISNLAVGNHLGTTEGVSVPKGGTLTLMINKDNVIVITGPALFQISSFTVDAAGRINASVIMESGSIVVSSPKADGNITVASSNGAAIVDTGVVQMTVNNGSLDTIIAQGSAYVTNYKDIVNLNAPQAVRTTANLSGSNSTCVTRSATQGEVNAAIEQAQKAQQELAQANAPVIPQAEIQSEDTEPSNPSTVVSGEQPPPP